eukprot:301462-Chlamydomonas_euryale.AAC.1
MVDLPPTLLDLAGADLSASMFYHNLDGVPVPFSAFNVTVPVAVNADAPAVSIGYDAPSPPPPSHAPPP